MADAMNGGVSWSADLAAAVRATALEAGFHLAGIAAAGQGCGQDSLDAARFAAWVETGRAGEMTYLKRRDAEGRLLREGVRVAFPWARSVVVCALSYDSDMPVSIDPAPADRGWIGRYAWSGKGWDEGNLEKGAGDDRPAHETRLVATDYHDELLARLRQVEACLRDAVACETKCYVDTGPLVERSLAAKAGIGWIGKNTCVINQELGSWLLLGAIVTSLTIDEEETAESGESPLRSVAETVAPDRCGSCTRCIDACPTDALVAPYEMDASRCIAYLTIEKKGAIPAEFREAMGRQVFGCDICQDVCPWNQRNRNERSRNQRNRNQRNGSGGNRAVALPVTPGMEPRLELVNPPLGWLAAMDAKEFKRWFKGSPLERTGRKRLHRNVAVAMGNSGDAEFLPKLREWSESDDAILAEAAQWAIEQIRRLDVHA